MVMNGHVLPFEHTDAPNPGARTCARVLSQLWFSSLSSAQALPPGSTIPQFYQFLHQQSSSISVMLFLLPLHLGFAPFHEIQILLNSYRELAQVSS